MTEPRQDPPGDALHGEASPIEPPDGTTWRSREEVLRDELAALVRPPGSGPTVDESPPTSPRAPAASQPPDAPGASVPTAFSDPPVRDPAAPTQGLAASSAAPTPPAAPPAAPPAGSAPPPAPSMDLATAPHVRSPFADVPLTPRRIAPAAFDLLAKSERDLRVASFYIGFLLLSTVGPAVALLWAMQVRFGDGLEDALSGSTGGVAALLLLVAVAGFVIAAIESRTLAIAVLAGRLEGRPLGAGRGVALVRRHFWRALAAGFVIGLLTGIANAAVEAVVGEPQVAIVATLVVGVLVEAPFVYAIAGIVLGEVGVGDALGRSTRLFGVRRRLAMTVALFGIASQLVLLLALFAGLDIVARVIDVIGFDAGSTFSVFVGTVVAGTLLFALGTLLFTAAALAAAPQVLAFTGLTHYARGLEPGRLAPRGRWPWDPFVTRPLAFTVLGALVLLVGAVTTLTD